jgi:hypothetical protein
LSLEVTSPVHWLNTQLVAAVAVKTTTELLAYGPPAGFSPTAPPPLVEIPKS